MRRAVFAEWVLSLVMARERAAALVGDLAEGSSSGFRFWMPVMRTASSATLAQMTGPGFPKAVLSVLLLAMAIRIMSTSSLTMAYLMSTPVGWTAYLPSMVFSVGAGLLGGIANRKLWAGHRVDTWTAIALFAALSMAWWVLEPQSVAAPMLLMAPSNLVLPLLGGTFLARWEWRRGVRA